MRHWVRATLVVATLAVGWMLCGPAPEEQPLAPTRTARKPEIPARSDRPRYDPRPDSAAVATTGPQQAPAPPSDAEANAKASAEAKAKADALRCSNSVGSEGCDFLHPSPAELLEMAKCGTVKLDYPVGLLDDGSFHLDDTLASAANVDARERQLVEQTTEEFRGELKRALVPLARELGVADELLAAAPLQQVFAEIKARESQEEQLAVRRQLARERAGLERAGVPRTPTERFEHVFVGLGDAYQASLARVLGPDRAEEMRAVRDGWGASMVASGSCDDDPPAN